MPGMSQWIIEVFVGRPELWGRPRLLRLLSRGQDIVEPCGCRWFALQVRVAQTIVIVESEDSKSIAGLDDQLDRKLRRLRRSDRVFQYIDVVGGTVDRQYD